MCEVNVRNVDLAINTIMCSPLYLRSRLYFHLPSLAHPGRNRTRGRRPSRPAGVVPHCSFPSGARNLWLLGVVDVHLTCADCGLRTLPLWPIATLDWAPSFSNHFVFPATLFQIIHNRRLAGRPPSCPRTHRHTRSILSRARRCLLILWRTTWTAVRLLATEA